MAKQKGAKYIDAKAVVSKEKPFKCRECDFNTTSRQGLKIHKSKAHFLQDAIFVRKFLIMKKKNEQTYHIVRYQCDEFDFMANEVITLDVHFGMKHSIKNNVASAIKNF